MKRSIQLPLAPPQLITSSTVIAFAVSVARFFYHRGHGLMTALLESPVLTIATYMHISKLKLN